MPTFPTPLPLDTEPMYATLGKQVPEGDDWTYELKYDGVRVLAHVTPDDARLVTRNGKEKTEQFPEIVAALTLLARTDGKPLVLDGEIVAMDRKGNPARFQALQDRVHLKDRETIEERSEKDPAAFAAFDLLAVGDRVLTDAPWTERRKELETRLHAGTRAYLILSESVTGAGEVMLRRAHEEGWEGVIAKRIDLPYRPGERSDHWKKLKIEYRQEFVVGGWTEPRRTRPHLGSLLLGYYDDQGKLVFAGGVGTGFTHKGLKAMRERLGTLERNTAPFTEAPSTREPAHWVKPEVVVEIKFTEWTAEDRLRQPVYLGVREDKDPKDVGREGASLQAGGKPL